MPENESTNPTKPAQGTVNQGLPDVIVNQQGYYYNTKTKQFCDKDGNPSATPVKALDVPTTLTDKDIESLVQARVDKAMEELAVQMASRYQRPSTETATLTEAFRNVIEEVQGSRRRTLGRLPVREEEVPVDDFLDKPVTFYAYSTKYAIFDDVRKGHAILPPYGRPIKFQTLFRSRRTMAGGRKSGSVIAVSYADVTSKKVVKWLREHSLYKIRFFDTVDEAKSVNALFADMLKKADAELGYSEWNIIEKAKSLGIQPRPDVSSLRSEVVYKMAFQKAQEEKNRVIIPPSDFKKQSSASPTSKSTASATYE